MGSKLGASFWLVLVGCGVGLLVGSCSTWSASPQNRTAYLTSISTPPGPADPTLVMLDGSTLVGNHVQMDVSNLRNVTFLQHPLGKPSESSLFLMSGGALVAEGGELFRVAGVASTVRLTDVRLDLSRALLLRVEGGEGQPGGQCDFTAEDQVLAGAMRVDISSQLRLALTHGTCFRGSINQNAPGGTVEVIIDGTSTWTLTADTHVTALVGAVDRVQANGYHLWVGPNQRL